LGKETGQDRGKVQLKFPLRDEATTAKTGALSQAPILR
jgi:hypothetical protein